jgi:hypothetical protein
MVAVPTPFVDGIHALTQAALEHGHAQEEIADIVRRVGKMLRYTVPRCGRYPSPTLIRLAALGPLAARIQNLSSELELIMLEILADAGVALEFETARVITVRYPDRCCDDDYGPARPDFYHPRRRVAIFCDSEAHHASPEARARDNGVTAALQRKGIVVLRFTSGQIRRHRLSVGKTILAHVAPSRSRQSKNEAKHDAA